MTKKTELVLVGMRGNIRSLRVRCSDKTSLKNNLELMRMNEDYDGYEVEEVRVIESKKFKREKK